MKHRNDDESVPGHMGIAQRTCRTGTDMEKVGYLAEWRLQEAAPGQTDRGWELMGREPAGPGELPLRFQVMVTVFKSRDWTCLPAGALRPGVPKLP